MTGSAVKILGLLFFLISYSVSADDFERKADIELLELELEQQIKLSDKTENKTESKTENKIKIELNIDSDLARSEEQKKKNKGVNKTTINSTYKVRLGVSGAYYEEFELEDSDEGRMVSRASAEPSLDLQSPHFYFSPIGRFGVLFELGYRSFDFNRQKVDYSFFKTGNTENLGTDVDGKIVYLTPVLFFNPFRNASLDHSLVLGLGFGLSHLSANGNMNLTERPASSVGADENRVFDFSGTGTIIKFLVDYQWKNWFVSTSFQVNVSDKNNVNYTYSGGAINFGYSFNL